MSCSAAASSAPGNNDPEKSRVSEGRAWRICTTRTEAPGQSTDSHECAAGRGIAEPGERAWPLPSPESKPFASSSTIAAARPVSRRKPIRRSRRRACIPRGLQRDCPGPPSPPMNLFSFRWIGMGECHRRAAQGSCGPTAPFLDIKVTGVQCRRLAPTQSGICPKENHRRYLGEWLSPRVRNLVFGFSGLGAFGATGRLVHSRASGQKKTLKTDRPNMECHRGFLSLEPPEDGVWVDQAVPFATAPTLAQYVPLCAGCGWLSKRSEVHAR